MHNLTPSFILEQTGRGTHNGYFDGVVVFVDTSGFTPLTVRLSEQGRDGAEVLADILQAVFEPLVEAVYGHGGFIAGFAGDAFKAIFPGITAESYLHALAAAEQIRTYMGENPSHKTKYGIFDFSVRLSMADGQVTWSVWTGEGEAAEQSGGYTFAGTALAQAIQGEDHADGGELVATQSAYDALRKIEPGILSGRGLMGDAEGYVAITQIAERLPATKPISAQESASLEHASTFYPPSLLNTQIRGEFRPVYTVFVNVQTLPEPGTEGDFLPLLFHLLHQYGGYLCRIGRIGANDPGGTFLLFWGAPSSHENDLTRALGFLLALRGQLEVPLRVGVTHSTVYAGFIGSPLREEYTCYGSSVNQAARQMGMAEWGQILLDGPTAGRAEYDFEIALAGHFELKGLPDTQPLFGLEEEQSQQGPTVSASTFVGRTAELSRLQDAIQPILTGQFGGLTLISGEAGIGKSRLVHRALDTFDDGQFQVFLCQTDEILRESLNPFRYFLQRYFDQAPNADVASNKANFDAKLDALVASTGGGSIGDELVRTRSFIGALVNLYWDDSLYTRLEPRLRFENMLSALRTLFLAESQRQPVVILLEDVHWLDDDSQTFLAQFMRTVDDAALTILATTRPTEQASTFLPGMVTAEITIAPFSASDLMIQARHHLAGEVSQTLCDLLFARAGGNPFFIEQMLLYLQEEDLLIQDSEGWKLVEESTNLGDSMATRLPTDLQTMLIARLDRLSLAVKQVVQTAAVLGREFSVQILSQMLHDDQTLESKVKSAEEAAVWEVLSELRYLFRHALLRDAAYDMQLQARRCQLHEVAALAMATLYEADLAPYYADLAYHWGGAADYEQEARYASLAGRHAADQFANADAVVYLSRALALTPDEDVNKRHELLLTREAVYGMLGDRVSQAADITALHTVRENLNDAELAAKIWLRDSDFAESIGEYHRAIEAAHQALATAPDSQEASIDALIRWGYMLMLQGDFAAAKIKLAQSAELAEANALKHQQALSLQHLTQLYSRLGQYEKGKAVGLQALEQAEEIAEYWKTGFGLNNVGICCLFMGEYDEAKNYFSQSLQIKSAVGDRRGAGAALQNLGLTAYYEGQLDRAMTYFERALDNRRATGERVSEGDMCYNLAVLYQTLGVYDTALTYFEQALQLHEETGYPQGMISASHNLGLLYHHMGQQLEAQVQCEKALAAAQELSIVPEQASALINLGHIYAAQSRPAEAQAAFLEAMELRRKNKQENLAIEALAGLLTLPHDDSNQLRMRVNEVWYFLDANGTTGMSEPFRVSLSLYRALVALEDERHQPLIQRTYDELQERATQISDTALRQSFLENVPTSRAIVRAYKQNTNM